MKKYLYAALSLIIVIMLASTLSACSTKTSTKKTSHIHKWSEWSTAKPSTCSEEGEAIRTCECGASQSHPINTLAHTVDSKVVTPATCLAGGYTTFICQCGYSYKAAETSVSAHTITEWTYTPQYSCVDGGERSGVCTVCNTSVKEELPKDEHVYSAHTTIPTETEQGYTTFTCVECGDSYNDYYTDPIGQTNQ